MLQHYWTVFWEIVRTPFYHIELVWGIVPLYFGWLVNELTSSKPSYRTAIQTGFGFTWAAAHWIWQYTHANGTTRLTTLGALLAVNMAVTLLVLLIGLVALLSGLHGKYPPYCQFLGHSRFANYFMIAIFPIQSNYLPWSWERMASIAIFAIPIWIAMQLVMLPLRK